MSVFSIRPNVDGEHERAKSRQNYGAMTFGVFASFSSLVVSSVWHVLSLPRVIPVGLSSRLAAISSRLFLYLETACLFTAVVY